METPRRNANDKGEGIVTKEIRVCVRVSVDVRKPREAGDIWFVLMDSVKLNFSTI